MTFHLDIAPMSDAMVKALAPSGVLRAGINMSNFLLVSERTAEGGPKGVSPDIAAAVAASLGLGLQLIPYANPGILADAAGADEWDIALIGAEPQRAETIAFTPAYAEIEATYLVPAGSSLQRIEDVDVAGKRVAVADRTAYGLWLDRNLRHAELVRAQGMDDSFATFVSGKLDALAGLRPKLMSDLDRFPAARLLEGRFMAVQQAIGAPMAKQASVVWLTGFVEAAKRQGLVGSLIDAYNVKGLSVAAG